MNKYSEMPYRPVPRYEPSSILKSQGLYSPRAQRVSTSIDHLHGQTVLKETFRNSHKILFEYWTSLKCIVKSWKHLKSAVRCSQWLTEVDVFMPLKQKQTP
jgi:hypothetical protein